MSKISQLKDKGEALAAEIMVDATTTLATRGITKRDKKIATIVAVTGMAGLSVAAAALTFAGNGGDGGGTFKAIADKLIKILHDLFDATKILVSAVAIALLAICIILSMTSKNERNVTEYKEWAKRIVIAWVIYMLLGEITTVIKSMQGSADAWSQVSGGT